MLLNQHSKFRLAPIVASLAVLSVFFVDLAFADTTSAPKPISSARLASSAQALSQAATSTTKKTPSKQISHFLLSLILFHLAESDDTDSRFHSHPKQPRPRADTTLKDFEAATRDLSGRRPTQWSENATNVKTRFHATKKEVALTLDACGSKGDGLDERIISHLERTQTPATIFLTTPWMKRHPREFQRLRKSPLFDLENHGHIHRPASVNGRSQYGIKGTKNLRDLYSEVEVSAQKLAKATGRKPHFFRAGTAYYDDVAVKAINRLGYQVAGFDVTGDAGATLPPSQVVRTFLNSRPGSIILAHVNHPERRSGEGVVQGIAALKRRGFSFVRLKDRELK